MNKRLTAAELDEMGHGLGNQVRGWSQIRSTSWTVHRGRLLLAELLALRRVEAAAREYTQARSEIKARQSYRRDWPGGPYRKLLDALAAVPAGEVPHG